MTIYVRVTASSRVVQVYYKSLVYVIEFSFIFALSFISLFYTENDILTTKF